MTPSQFYRVKACGPGWCTPDQWEALCQMAEESLKSMHGSVRMVHAEQAVSDDIAGRSHLRLPCGHHSDDNCSCPPK